MIFSRRLLGLLCLLCSSGCVDSENPLEDPAKAKVDERLIGQWESTDKTKPGVWTFAKSEVQKKFPGSMTLVVISGTKTEEIDKQEALHLFRVKVGQYDYANLFDPNEKDKNEGKPKKRKFLIWKYEVDGDRLVLRQMDSEKIAEVVESGKLAGTVKKGGLFLDVHLTESSGNLRRFLLDGGDKLVFTEELKVEYSRVKKQEATTRKSGHSRDRTIGQLGSTVLLNVQFNVFRRHDQNFAIAPGYDGMAE